jgi:hypothetical protein
MNVNGGAMLGSIHTPIHRPDVHVVAIVASMEVVPYRVIYAAITMFGGCHVDGTDQ